MRKVIAIGALAGLVALAACSHAGADAGPSVSRNYPVGPFNAIEVAGPYDVEVSTGGNSSVSATGPQKMIEGMVVEVQGDKLLIHPQQQHGMFQFGWSSSGKVRVQVTAKELAAASLAGSGDIRINQVHGDGFEGAVGGSGDLDIDSLEVRTLKLSVGGSGDVKAASGRAQSVSYEIGGSGDIDARGVEAQTADISIAGSGDISAHVTGTANVSITGSGDVEITGGAKCSVSKQGSGTVHCD